MNTLDGVDVAQSAVADFARQLRCRTTLPGDTDYDVARAVWNGRVDKHPMLIVYPTCTEEVIQAVRFATRESLPLSVRGAGHSVSGACVAQAGLVIDTAALKDLTIDSEARTATVGAGITTGEFVRTLHTQGFIATTGSHDSVGLAGITLCGGMGILMGKYGLVCDNLLSAEIVTADGLARTVSATENPELFWALRGGGGNFGVVTSLTFRIYPVEPTVAGVVFHPIARIRELLDFYREFTRQLPDELNAFFLVQGAPDGNIFCGIMACYTGESLAEGERLVAPLREFGPPILQMLGPAPYLSLLDALKDHDPAGNHYAFSMRSLPSLTDELLDAIAAKAASLSSPHSAVVLYHLHGVAARIAPEGTAFAARHIPYFLGVYANWVPGDDTPHLVWQETLLTAIAPYAAKVGYMGLTGGCDGAEVETLYGPNYARLARIKATYDPQNLFCNTDNILPSRE